MKNSSSSQLKKLSILLLLLSLSSIFESRKTEEELFEEFKNLMIQLNKWKSLTQKEKDFRFGVYKKNLGIVSKPVPPPKDKFGRPLLGLVAFSYKKRVNKFAFYTEIEFKTQFLMNEQILYKASFSQELRTNPNYSFRAFLRFFEGASFDESNFDQYSYQETQETNTSSNSSQSSPDPQPFSPSEPFFPTNASDFFESRLLQQSELPANTKRSVNWEHLFNGVFDQLDCNSCYATASLSAVEALHHKKHSTDSKINLSVQEVLDCSRENAGCEGGQPSAVMKYLEKYGVAYADQYEYQGKILQCRAQYADNSEKEKTAPPGQRILEQLLSGGPSRLLQGSRFSSSWGRFRQRSPQIQNFRQNRFPSSQLNSIFQGQQNRMNSNFGGTRNKFQSFRPQQNNRFNNMQNLQNRRRNQNQRRNRRRNQRANRRENRRANRRGNKRGNQRGNQRRSSLGSLSRFRNFSNFNTSPINTTNGFDLEDFDEPETISPQPSQPEPSPPVQSPNESPAQTNNVADPPLNSQISSPSENNEVFDLQPLDELEATSAPDQEISTVPESEPQNNTPASQPETPVQTDRPEEDSNDKSDVADLTDFEDFPEEEEGLEVPEMSEKPEVPEKADDSKPETTSDVPPSTQAEPESNEEQNSNPFGFGEELADLDQLPDEDFPEEEEPAPAPEKKPEETPRPPKREGPQKRFEDVSGFYFIRQNVVDLIRALQYGPVVVAHFVSEPFKFYSSGVFDGDGCDDRQW